MIASAFEIPGDADDSSLGLALGALLNQSKYSQKMYPNKKREKKKKIDVVLFFG